MARHIAMFIANKPIIKGKQVLPIVCHNSLCVNPDHLVSGDKARFWAKVDKLSDDECWPWIAELDKDNYGMFSVIENGKYKKCRASVYALLLVGIEVPKGMCVCHTCDNPPCVNPKHLWIGTVKDNNADKVSKNRQTRGEDQVHAVLTEDLIPIIRKRHAEGESLGSIARSLGVGTSTIFSVVKRKTWKHIVP